MRPTSRGSRGTLLGSQTKSNPYKVISAHNLDIISDINILTDSNKTLSLEAKNLTLLTNSKSGLTKIGNYGIKQSFSSTSLNIDITYYI